MTVQYTGYERPVVTCVLNSHLKTVTVPNAVLIQLSSWRWAQECSKHVEEYNKYIKIKNLCIKLVKKDYPSWTVWHWRRRHNDPSKPREKFKQWLGVKSLKIRFFLVYAKFALKIISMESRSMKNRIKAQRGTVHRWFDHRLENGCESLIYRKREKFYYKRSADHDAVRMKFRTRLESQGPITVYRHFRIIRLVCLNPHIYVKFFTFFLLLTTPPPFVSPNFMILNKGL